MLRSFTLIAILGCCLSDEAKFHFEGHEFDRTHLGDTIDLASVKMLKEAYNSATDKNLISSPLGVLELLSMYAGGAGAGAKQEVVKVLGAANYDELYNSYTTLSSRYFNMDANVLNIANAMFVNQSSELNEKFSSRIVSDFHSKVDKVNFNDPHATAEVINRWSDEKTKGHIKNPIPENSIDSSVVALLANVIFFQGQWHVPFNASLTQDKDFHLDKTNVVKKPMMHLEQTLFYHYSSDFDAQMIELPYKQPGFRMVVVLPNQIEGLPTLLEKVAQKGLLTDVFALEPAGHDIILDIPKFEFQSELDLNVILPKVGISKIFSEPATGIINGPVVVSKAFQKAIVKVDEEGATAGAFTGFVIVPASSDSTPPPPKDLKIDHPFLFAILHEDVILFIGTYTH